MHSLQGRISQDNKESGLAGDHEGDVGLRVHEVVQALDAHREDVWIAGEVPHFLLAHVSVPLIRVVLNGRRFECGDVFLGISVVRLEASAIADAMASVCKKSKICNCIVLIRSNKIVIFQEVFADHVATHEILQINCASSREKKQQEL